MMECKNLLNKLFGKNYSIVEEKNESFYGVGELKDKEIHILGTPNNTYIGTDIALYLSDKILKIIKNNKREPILILVDTLGQKLSHHDELLGINLYLSHLSKCIELARLKGHKVISIGRNESVSGGSLCTNLLADSCFALDCASYGVMNLPSMSRITQIPLRKLEQLSTTSPLFDTNVNNYYVMGAIETIWNIDEDLSSFLWEAINNEENIDNRRILGSNRKGRKEALRVSSLVEEA